jgi:hypothetical protein
MFCGCFGFGLFEVDWDLPRMGDLKIPSLLQFQITKHLNLAFFDLKLNFFVDDLEGSKFRDGGAIYV